MSNLTEFFFCITAVSVFISILISVGSACVSIIYKLKKYGTIAGIILFAIAFVHLQFLINGEAGGFQTRDMIFAGMELAASCLCFTVILRASVHVLNTFSIKESMDMLSSGICYYKPNGMLRLVNKKMEDIGDELFGKPIMNGIEFYEGLIRKSEDTPDGNGEYIELPDGKRYFFVQNEMELSTGKIYELIITDITEEHEKRLELEEKKKDAEKVSESFRELTNRAKLAAIERENLQAKIMLHDDLGEINIIAKRFLESGNVGPINEKDLTEEWISTLEAIKRDAVGSDEYDFERAYKTANLLGAELQAKEIFEDDLAKKRVVAQALVCALNNAVRHGKAGKVIMDIKDTDEGRKLITISNNGLPAVAGSSEKGGLTSLRKNVEALGGQMQIIWEKGAELRIIL